MLLKIDLTTFYTRGDERRFFQGLSDISAIKNIRGDGRGLVMTLNLRHLNKEMTRELIAILWRYSISLAPLAMLAGNKRFLWLKDERLYWYGSMFSINVSQHAETRSD